MKRTQKTRRMSLEAWEEVRRASWEEAKRTKTFVVHILDSKGRNRSSGKEPLTFRFFDWTVSVLDATGRNLSNEELRLGGLHLLSAQLWSDEVSEEIAREGMKKYWMPSDGEDVE